MRLPKSLKDLYDRVITDEISRSLVIFAMLSLFLISITFACGYFSREDFWVNVLAGADGMLIQIIIFGVFVTWLSDRGAKKRQVQQHLDEIDDFRNWPEQSAAHRIRGSIIRLNKLGVSKINLSSCYLAHANLEHANLNNSECWKANFEGCDLDDITLQHSDLWNANLSGAFMRNAKLFFANLDSADLTNAKLTGADLTNANLKNTTLLNTDLTDAILDNADLTEAKNLVPAQLSKVKSATNTKLDEELFDRVRKLNMSQFRNDG